MPTPKTLFAINLTEHSLEYSPLLRECLFFLFVLPQYNADEVADFISYYKSNSKVVVIKCYTELKVEYEKFISIGCIHDALEQKNAKQLKRKLSQWIQRFGTVTLDELHCLNVLLFDNDELIQLAIDAFLDTEKPNRNRMVGFMSSINILSELQINAVLDYYNLEKNRIRNMLTISYS